MEMNNTKEQSSRYNRTDTHSDCGEHALGQHGQDLHRLKPDRVPALREEVNTASNLYLRSYILMTINNNRKISLLQWSIMGYINNT